MLLDLGSVGLEAALFLSTLWWWSTRVAPVVPRRRPWNLLRPESSSAVIVPVESLIVNIASLLGTLLGGTGLRPSQAVFSAALVASDAWPLLTAPFGAAFAALNHTTTGAVRAWLRFGALACCFFVVQRALYGTYPAAIHICEVATRATAALGAVAVAGLIASEFLATASSSVVVPSLCLLNPVPPSRGMEHGALIATYFVYAIMLVMDYAGTFVTGPWVVYCSGSIIVELVKYLWVARAKTLSVVMSV